MHMLSHPHPEQQPATHRRYGPGHCINEAVESHAGAVLILFFHGKIAAITLLHRCVFSVLTYFLPHHKYRNGNCIAYSHEQ